jgi:hypothetical protein
MKNFYEMSSEKLIDSASDLSSEEKSYYKKVIKINFLKLRNSEHAQKEVQEIAQKMAHCVKSIENRPFKYTLKAFGY